MDSIEHCARVSVYRGLAFAGLGIVLVVVGLIDRPALALQVGATLVALVGVVLAYKGWAAPARNYRRTEVWLLLGRRHDLPEHRAQGVIGGVLSRLYWHCAGLAAALALTLCLAAFGASLAVEPAP